MKGIIATTNYGKVQDVPNDQPNQETIAAMLEAERIAHDPSVKKYTDLDEMFAERKK